MNNDISTPEALAALRESGLIPFYRQIPRDARLQWLGGRVVRLNQLLHKETVDEYLNQDVLALDENIMDELPLSALTLDEIGEAWDRGVAGAYGPYYGVNILSLMNFLRSYLDTPKKREATKIQQAHNKERERAALSERMWREVQERIRKEGGQKDGA